MAESAPNQNQGGVTRPSSFWSRLINSASSLLLGVPPAPQSPRGDFCTVIQSQSPWHLDHGWGGSALAGSLSFSKPATRDALLKYLPSTLPSFLPSASVQQFLDPRHPRSLPLCGFATPHPPHSASITAHTSTQVYHCRLSSLCPLWKACSARAKTYSLLCWLLAGKGGQ